LQGEAQAGLIDLDYLDDSGFAPTLPTSYTWAREGTRVVVPSEAPQGRRVNVVGALAPDGPAPRLVYASRAGKRDSTVVLQFICQQVAGLPADPAALPAGYRRARPCVIVLDNYSVHRSKVVQAVQPALEAAGGAFYYLPPYSPELNQIEPLWRHVKYEDLPERSYATGDALKAAVDQVLDDHAARRHQSTMTFREVA
jgi:hypothetical protein